jgi:hypothetical protein
VRIEQIQVEQYGVYLKDKSRPPSRGGNGRAWHQHVLTIGGERYSFLAPWSGKLVYKGETVSFDWEWDESSTYRNVDRASVVAWSKAGKQARRARRQALAHRGHPASGPAQRVEGLSATRQSLRCPSSSKSSPHSDLDRSRVHADASSRSGEA